MMNLYICPWCMGKDETHKDTLAIAERYLTFMLQISASVLLCK